MPPFGAHFSLSLIHVYSLIAVGLLEVPGMSHDPFPLCMSLPLPGMLIMDLLLYITGQHFLLEVSMDPAVWIMHTNHRPYPYVLQWLLSLLTPLAGSVLLHGKVCFQFSMSHLPQAIPQNRHSRNKRIGGLMDEQKAEQLSGQLAG